VLKKELNNFEVELNNINTKVYNKEKPVKFIYDIKEASEFLKIALPVISEERLQEYDSYNKYKNQLEVIQRELTLKENQLKEINTIQIQDCIDIINK
jgi:hypothetical protein